MRQLQYRRCNNEIDVANGDTEVTCSHSTQFENGALSLNLTMTSYFILSLNVIVNYKLLILCQRWVHIIAVLCMA